MLERISSLPVWSEGNKRLLCIHIYPCICLFLRRYSEGQCKNYARPHFYHSSGWKNTLNGITSCRKYYILMKLSIYFNLYVSCMSVWQFHLLLSGGHLSVRKHDITQKVTKMLSLILVYTFLYILYVCLYVSPSICSFVLPVCPFTNTEIARKTLVMIRIILFLRKFWKFFAKPW